MLFAVNSVTLNRMPLSATKDTGWSGAVDSGNLPTFIPLIIAVLELHPANESAKMRGDNFISFANM
ncbi:hypothetical protein GCM10010099_00720 [Streptomyces cinereus]|nr:hypothetical protein GCM10010099_00720 [Streptomyces cinereus]